MSARTCPTCGHPLSPFARFCVNCGSDVGDTVVTEPVREGTKPDAVPWRAWEALVVFLLSMVIGVIGTFPLALLVRRTDSVQLSVGGELIGEVGLLLAVLGWVWFRYRRGPRALGVAGPPENAALGLAVGIVGFIGATVAIWIVSAIVSASGGGPLKQPDQLGVQGKPLSTALIVVIGFTVMVLAPIAEEMFFRGFLFRALRRWMKPWPAVLLSAGCFAVVHVFPVIMFPIFVLGAIFAWVVEWRGSIVPTIVAHMTFNLIGFLQLLHNRV